MAKLLRGQQVYDENGTRLGVTIFYLVGGDLRTGWLSEADITGLTLAQIKALAQSVADADPGLPGETDDLFNFADEAKDDFDNLPGWATWTGAEAEDYVHSLIFNGDDETTIHAQIDAQVTNLNTAKEAIKSIASEIIDIRNTLEKAARAIMYLRDIYQ